MTEQDSAAQKPSVMVDLVLYALLTAAAMVGFILLMQWRFRVVFPELESGMSGNGLRQARDLAFAPLLNLVLFGLAAALVNIVLFPVQTALLHMGANKTESEKDVSWRDLLAHSTLFHAGANLATLIGGFLFGYAATLTISDKTSFGLLVGMGALLIVAISPFSFKFVMMPLLMVYYLVEQDRNLMLIVATLISLAIGAALFYGGAKVVQRVYGGKVVNAFSSYFAQQISYGFVAGLLVAIGFFLFSLTLTR